MNTDKIIERIKHLLNEAKLDFEAIELGTILPIYKKITKCLLHFNKENLLDVQNHIILDRIKEELGHVPKRDAKIVLINPKTKEIMLDEYNFMAEMIETYWLIEDLINSGWEAKTR